MSTLADLADFLEGLGLVTLPNPPAVVGDLFLGTRPDKPPKITCLYEYPGGAPEYVQDQQLPVAEKPQLQVVTRAKTYEEAHDQAWRVWRALAVVTNATLGTTYYRSIRPNGSPAVLLRDSDDRVLMFFNASIEKEVSLVPS